MKTFSVAWEIFGFLDIEAESEQEAEEKFYKLSKEEVIKDYEIYGIDYIEEVSETEKFDDENLDQYWSEIEYDEY